MAKIVYILGAGFSKGIGAPLQAEIIKDIFEINPMDIDSDYRTIFRECRERFRNFLDQTLFISSADFHKISLEDIYTPIDRCILDNVSFRNLQRTELLDLRQKINALIVILIKQRLKDISEDNYVQRLADFLVLKRKRKVRSDPFSILSLNWDIIIDNALKTAINSNEGVVDYCCYITPYNTYENLMPGLLALGKGMYNVKLLKMHGSMNWLQCQRCQRLYITFYQKIAAEEYLTRPKCRLCQKNFSTSATEDGGPYLLSQLIMPTFLKDLNNIQIKLIWQNAGIELSEATKVIFMGYSFPSADFEIRQLLSRTVRHNANIIVVLKDRPSDDDINSPEYRYKSFFGKRNINFKYNGVENYIDELIREHT
ncbi:MAG: hypothetical protein IIC75_02195 [Bacteroidetes bacterium]|nr:hypothetical protein [Bacteroidota bacterium]